MSVKIGITGHRRLLEPENVKEEIRECIRKILRKKDATDFEGYSALASGADMLFAELVLEMGGKLQIVLPFDQKEYEKDFENDEIKEKFKELLYKGSNVEVLNVKDPSQEKQRKRGYLECGKLIADLCHVMIAAWDEEKAHGIGGTGDIVHHAKSKNKEIHIIPALQDKSHDSEQEKLLAKLQEEIQDRLQEELQSIKHSRDEAAINYQTRYEWQWIFAILLGVGAAVLLAIGISFHLKEITKAVIASVEFVAVLAFAIIIYQLEKGYLKSGRIQNRREAERLRVIEKLYEAGLEIKHLDNHDFISDKVKSLEEGYIVKTGSGQTPEFSKIKLLDLVNDQMHYHETTRQKKNYKRMHRLEMIQKFLLIAFIVFTAIHLFTAWIDYSNDASIPHWPGLFLTLIIPPTYAAIEGYIYFKEFKRNLNDSAIMHRFFSLQKKELEKIDINSGNAKEQLVTIANSIRNKMDEENTNWAHTTDIKTAPGP